jgi:hypothetical protein
MDCGQRSARLNTPAMPVREMVSFANNPSDQKLLSFNGIAKHYLRIYSSPQRLFQEPLSRSVFSSGTFQQRSLHVDSEIGCCEHTLKSAQLVIRHGQVGSQPTRLIAVLCRQFVNADITAIARIRACEWGEYEYWVNRISGYLDGTFNSQHALPPRICYVAVEESSVVGPSHASLWLPR